MIYFSIGRGRCNYSFCCTAKEEGCTGLPVDLENLEFEKIWTWIDLEFGDLWSGKPGFLENNALGGLGMYKVQNFTTDGN